MDRPIVTVSEGKIQGATLKSVLGKNYLAFRGIPYARPPLGSLRFKEPQLPSKWTGILDTSKRTKDRAMQNPADIYRPKKVYGSEDCLYLNVYANRIGRRTPVMFYIHGGGYVEGTGNDDEYPFDYFTLADVVLVCVNYRLGPLGFLNLGHEVAPGNQGLKDIIFALHWVRKNIEAFGGDPSNVTIFGNSAGAIVCHLFTLLPCAKGLFHKAILQSGHSFWHKNLLEGDDSFKNGFKIASLLGHDSTDPIEVVEYLRSVPAEKLVELETRILTRWEKTVLGQSEYGPVFDANYTKDPIVPLPLSELLKNDADIPIIIGHTANESLLVFTGKFGDDEHFKYYNDNIEEFLKNRFSPAIEASKFDEIMKDIRRFYLKDQPISLETVWNLIELLTNISYINNDRKIVDNRNGYARAATYLYSFSYLGDQPTIYQYDHGPQLLEGVAHADELSYIFPLPYINRGKEFPPYPLEGSTDRLVMERIIKMWTSFAATGNPTPERDDKLLKTIWKPSTKGNLNYLDISAELALIDDKNHDSRPIYELLSRYYHSVEI